MRERPILMSAPMVLATLEDRKSQTRRVVKHQPFYDQGSLLFHMKGSKWQSGSIGAAAFCPYGKPGDRLYVREKFKRLGFDASAGLRVLCGYQDSSERWVQVPSRDDVFLKPNWIPSIHMPRWASRITLEITDVRVQRLQDISEEDAIAEGIYRPGIEIETGWTFDGHRYGYAFAASAYRELWNEINGIGSWDANPWVWALTFKRVEVAG